MKRNKNRTKSKLPLEILEDRRLMSSTSFINGVFSLKGNANTNNTFSVSTVYGNRDYGWADNQGEVTPEGSTNQIIIYAGNKKNQIDVAADVQMPVEVIMPDGSVQYVQPGKDVTINGSTTTKKTTPAKKPTPISTPVTTGSTTSTTGSTTTTTGSITGTTGSTTSTTGSTTGTTGSTTSTTGSTTGTTGSTTSTTGSTTGTAGSTTSTTGSTTSTTSSTTAANGSTSTGAAVTSDGTGTDTGDPAPFVDTTLQAKITVAGSTTIYAGMGVEVNATSSSLDVGTPLTAQYTWNFGDTTSGSQFNTYAGWNGGHVYANAGTYTVTLTVTNQNGVSSTVTSQVTVLSDNTLKAIYVSPTGNDANDGSSASDAIQSVAQLNKLLTSNSIVYFQSGATFNVTKSININGFSNVIMTTYGSGAPPVLNFVGPAGVTNFGNMAIISSQVGTTNVAINGLSFTSPYSAKGTAPNGITAVGTNIAVYNCTFSQTIGDCFLLNSSPNGVIVQNNTAPAGFQSYFAYIMGSNLVFQGNTVGLPGSLTQHVLRSDGTTDVYIGFNNFSTVYGSTLDLQIGSYTYVAHNTLDGPNTIGPLQNAVDHPQDTWMAWTVLDGNTLTSKDANVATGTLFVGPSSWHTMIRNNIFTADGEFAVIIQPPDITYGKTINDVQIIGNTAIDNGTMGGFLMVDSTANGIVVADNLLEAPNLIIGKNQACPIFVGSADLSSFTLISHNIWGYGTAKASGGLTTLEIISAVTPWQGQGFTTAATWDAMPQVQGDTFEELSLDSINAPSATSVAAGGGVWVPGLINDFNGAARVAGSITVGAVQL